MSAMLEKLVEVIREEFVEISNQEIHADTIINDIIPFSSLNIAILLTCIELEFDKIIPPIKFKSCETIGDLCDLIESTS